jgi:hypothetical protein
MAGGGDASRRLSFVVIGALGSKEPEHDDGGTEVLHAPKGETDWYEARIMKGGGVISRRPLRIRMSCVFTHGYAFVVIGSTEEL